MDFLWGKRFIQNRVNPYVSPPEAPPLLKFRLYGFVIVSIGTGGFFPQDLTFRHFAHKQHMAAQIQLFQHLAAEHGIGMLCQVHKTVMAALHGKTLQLIGIPTRLHTKIANGLKRYALCQHADVEHAAFFDHLPGQIALLDGDHQFCRVIGYLKTGIGDTAVIFVRFPGAEHK